MSYSIFEQRHKQHMCQWRSFVCPWCDFNAHALCAHVIQYGLEDTFLEPTRLSEDIKLYSILTLRKCFEDASILANACSNKG
jgi:hypothetical protein